MTGREPAGNSRVQVSTRMMPSVCDTGPAVQREESVRAFELTFFCFQRIPLLTSERRNRVLLESIERTLRRKGLELVAHVFMPEHVHLIVVPGRTAVSIPRLLYIMKRTFAQWMKGELHESDRSLLKRLTVREAPGRYTFRCWQPGPGRVRELASVGSLAAAISTIHTNPVRRGLCAAPDQWKWSSWHRHNPPVHKSDPDQIPARTPSAETLLAVPSP